MRKLRVVGLNFDHMHMGDLLRLCHEHPGVEIAGICDEDPARMQAAVRNFGLGAERVFTNARRCLECTAPDFVILCPATARHAEYVELAAPFGAHLLVEKPFAATLAEADRMIAAARKARRLLAINWPLRWVPSHVTAHRLVREGRIGELQEVHYYDGNRGPLWHTADKLETTPTAAMKRRSWFYKRREAAVRSSITWATAPPSEPGSTAARSRSRSPRSSTARAGSRLTSTASPSRGTRGACRNSRPAGVPSLIPG